MELVSEFITAQARLSLIVEENNLHQLAVISEHFEKLSQQLRDNALVLD